MNIVQIASALPSWRVSSEEIAQWVNADPVFIREKIGISQRRFLAANETTTTLALQACKNLFNKTNVTVSDIELLILITQNGEYQLPHGAALLQHALDLPTSVAAFDINLGCSGYVYGLVIVKSFMQMHGAKTALLVTCDPYSKIMARTDRDTMPLFGDAATATLLSSANGLRIADADFGTDGGGAEHLIVRRAEVERGIGLHAAQSDVSGSNSFLSMNGRAIFNFMMTRVPRSVIRCLEKNRIDKGDVDYFVFHQASKYLLEALSEKMKLPAAKVPISIRETGNTVSSTIPLALECLMKKEDLSDKTLVLSGFGVGLSWGTVLLAGQKT